MKAIVTITTESYAPLVPLWHERLRHFTSIPCYLLVIGDGLADFNLPGVKVVRVNPWNNPFDQSTPNHACAEKLRIFHNLPQNVKQVLFIDVDVMVLNEFWNDSLFDATRAHLVVSPDHFVGYKEKMEDEFRPFDPSFRMRYLSSGEYAYFNTGVFFASREAHSRHFDSCFGVWRSYVEVLGRPPSIFDQNVFNYYLISRRVPVLPMPVNNNCLRQYPYVLRDGQLTLSGQPVNAFHFNGGNGPVKLKRWLEMSSLLCG